MVSPFSFLPVRASPLNSLDMNMLPSPISRKSLLWRLGVLMALIILLALVGMGSSVVIAETTQGVATAVNQSGSLRMQSYRIATGLASLELPAARRYPHPPMALIEEFQARFTSPRLTDAIPSDPGHQLRRAYDLVARQWDRSIAPLVKAQARGDAPAARASFLQEADGFVANIDDMVRRLEEYAESKIEILRIVQATCMLLTILTVIVSLFLVQQRLIAPLRDLLDCAAHARKGDFTHRSQYVSEDELGRLGHAFNVMAEDLSKTYADLEKRVRNKTEDLALKNRSLDLLYATSRQVNGTPVTEQSLQLVLQDIERKLSVGPSTICLHEQGSTDPGHRFATTRRSEGGGSQFCWQAGCRACMDVSTGLMDIADARGNRCRAMCFPIRDRERHFGVLMVDLHNEVELEPWQGQVLETVAGHIGSALNNDHRAREDRRLVLHEERGVIARELHDSLAQSLSYLKIQISRLDASLSAGSDLDITRPILAELREGVTSAYRQLRELLTTFRLKMDGRGLNKALVDTMQEFRNRSRLEFQLDNRLPPGCLGPNEEIHVLQIVREALSNVIRHARADNARILLHTSGEQIEVLVEDDGRGLPPGQTPDEQNPQHYGITIMKERALSLNGGIEICNLKSGGTRMRLSFRRKPAYPDLELVHAR